MVRARRRRLGQNFLADPNLLDAIVRQAALDPGDVVLEVGGGGGALTGRLALEVAHLHVIELDRELRDDLDRAAGAGAVSVHWGDAMTMDLSSLDPAPNKLVANLPYSVATPVLLRTIEELPGLEEWVVMVQREIADRLRAGPGSRTYGAPSVLVQLSCEVELLRKVGRKVFSPQPRVDSALIRLRRRDEAPAPAVRTLVHQAFAHRRKSLARSVDLARPGSRDELRTALSSMGLPEDSRAEALAPAEFVRLAELIGPGDGGHAG